ncbi:ABC transporter ATP-binding protein [Venenivibrio stagnispumantis]|uniref:Peptide/nickel transport system ATP-binding protein/oligopeptide transport system ATP-binding protein n=1 Tax=Venenivibrio stagnispumantis TaxID=407998 RepID=A0AA46ACN5_9AQUI|nr:peptide/nickel transport system ATP-binding protein/oligopeptide transport system ATP-binding protein [Venenivibrio stagnispumantis]
MKEILKVDNLKVDFYIGEQKIEAVKGISFSLFSNEIVAIVGESGSGKSVTCQAILDILPSYAKVEGNILFQNKNIKNLSKEEKRQIRGNKISMVFQEPSAVLNPLLTVGEQIVETIKAHNNVSDKEAKDIAIQTLKKVEIPQPEKRFYQYPHELSGGLKQRVVIAIAIVNNPVLLLADEPTTALDVTTSAKILDLFLKLKEDYKMSILIITHDLGVVAQVADRVIVMYRGEILEQGDVYQIFENPISEYTKMLLNSRFSIRSRN